MAVRPTICQAFLNENIADAAPANPDGRQGSSVSVCDVETVVPD
jgi:hypothetical protein